VSQISRVCVSLWAIAVVATLVPSAHAGPITDVNVNFNGLNDNSNNAAVQNAVQAAWTASGRSGFVSVFGAQGALTYNGDGHVVGPLSGVTVTSRTLGTSDHGVFHAGSFDGFIVNDGSGHIRIVLPQAVNHVSFDYEIFPNAGEQTAGNPPDFTFLAGNASGLTTMLHTVGVVPQAGDLFPHSPFSGPNDVETTPQFIGSASFTLPAGTTILQFNDWPDRIGVNHLALGDQPAVIPEPQTWLLFGVGAAGLAAAGCYRRWGRLSAAAV
jgi:hypothetical protein